ncbi:MAG: hypothetical protein ACREYF_09595 [Gammaproteobacteria bacterium]
MWLSFLDSFERATWWQDLANMALLLSLAVGVIATLVIVITSSTKEEFLKRDLAATSERAAGAHERAAELERQAAGLRLELEQEIQKRAPRALTDEQKSALTTALGGKIREINVVVQKDLEAQSFALQLEIALQAAGARLRAYEMPPGDLLYVPAGVMMYMPGGARDDREMKDDPLYIALKKANLYGGFTAKPFGSPRDISPGAPMLPTDQHIVYVGQKSPY